MKRTYIVVKSGIYVQDVYGPFSIANARRSGNRLASLERDDYHRFTVRRLYKRGGIGKRIFAEFRGKNPAPRRVGHYGAKA